MQGTQGTQGRMRSEVVKHVKKMWKRCEKLQQNERDMWKTYVKHVVKKLCHESRQSNSRVSIESRSPGPNCHDRSSPEGFYRRSWRSIKASTESLNDVSRLYEIIRMMLWPCDLVTWDPGWGLPPSKGKLEARIVLVTTTSNPSNPWGQRNARMPIDPLV